MSGVNKVILVGRLGKDPEVRTVNSHQVANFTMATSEAYKDRTTGEKKEVTEWHNITLWRGLAEIAEKYLHKGDLVYIEGKLRTRSWEKDGVTRYITEVIGDNMTMLSTKGSAGGSTRQERPAPAPAPAPSPQSDAKYTENTGFLPDTSFPDDAPF